MATLIGITGAGASGSAGSGSTPASLHLFFTGTGQEGAGFSGGLTATGGVLPYTFSDPVFSLPPGLVLDPATGGVFGIPTQAGTYSFTGAVTDAATSSLVATFAINIAFPIGGSARADVTSIVGRDVGHGTDAADPDTRLVSFSYGVVANFASTPHEYLTIYTSKDNGTTFYWVGYPHLWTASGQEFFLQDLRPVAAETWKVACVVGTLYGDASIGLASGSLPAGAVISAGFSVAALSLPSATDGTSPANGAGAGGNWPYNAQTDDHVQYFKIPDLTLDLSGAFADPNAFAVTNSYQDLDASHSAIGPEHVNGTAVPVNGVVNFGPLIGNYGTDGSSYVRTGNLAFVRRRVIISNHVDLSVNGWSNFTTTSTRQADVGGGAGYIDIEVAVGGVPPGSEIVNTDYAANFGIYSKFLDPNFDQAVPGLVSDPGNALWGPGYLGSAIWLTQIPAPGVVTVYSGGYLGRQYVGLRGASVQIGQLLSVAAGHSYFFSVVTESTNTGGGSHNLKFIAQWVDGAGGSISTSTVTIATGYVSAWATKTGYITAPAGAAMATIYFSTDASEPSAGEWFLTTLQIQDTLDQTANNQQQTTAPAAGAVDYSALRAISAIDASESYYGRQEIKLTGPGGSNVDILVGTGGVAQVSLEDDTGANGLHFAFSNVGIAITVLESGVAYSAYSGTMSSASSANKPIKHGFVVF